MKTKFYGVGVGPGDPDLLTIKAKNIINHVDVLLCPAKREDADSFAYQIVAPHLENKAIKLEKLVYPMHYNLDRIETFWRQNGQKISNYLIAGKTCAFITLGDPTVYSTFIYTLPYINKTVMDLEIIPGIPSFCAVASEIKQPLMVWEESLKIIPVRKNDSEHLYKQIMEGDNLVLMKPSNDTSTIVKALRQLKLEDNFMIISKVGTNEAMTISDIDTLERVKLPYLSTMIIKKGGFCG